MISDLENPKLIAFQYLVSCFINPQVFILNSNRQSNPVVV